MVSMQKIHISIVIANLSQHLFKGFKIGGSAQCLHIIEKGETINSIEAKDKYLVDF